jgi:hypothetical protein
VLWSVNAARIQPLQGEDAQVASSIYNGQRLGSASRVFGKIHTVALPNLLQVMRAAVNRLTRRGAMRGPEERIGPSKALKAIKL